MPSPSSPVEELGEGAWLLIHTATGRALVALGEGGALGLWKSGELPRGGARELPGLVEEALAQGGDLPLRGVACFLGPGSFTGIKVGLAFGRGFARARGLPLLGCDNLEVLAAASPQIGQILVAVDALRGECLARRYLVGEEGAFELEEDLGRLLWEDLPDGVPVLVETSSAKISAEVIPPESLLQAAFGLLRDGKGRSPEPVWTRPSWAEESVGAPSSDVVETTSRGRE